ncbi:hypothetical protein EX30DRAFT_343912 [Ascodesmis nigricans]|uniref:RRM domain-containing protein n=1 Tax=Ascodesmis nigricans TaxID=341454 RepID=A0A4S2MLD3_9PEZI|nr:hypothetical protein EX30DRAFT_343912 [Ascodesmis nigricans]
MSATAGSTAGSSSFNHYQTASQDWERASHIAALFPGDPPSNRSPSSSIASTVAPGPSTPAKETDRVGILIRGTISGSEEYDEEHPTTTITLAAAGNDLVGGLHGSKGPLSFPPKTTAISAIDIPSESVEDTLGQRSALYQSSQSPKATNTTVQTPETINHPPLRKAQQQSNTSETPLQRGPSITEAKSQDRGIYSSQHAQKSGKPHDAIMVRVPLTLLMELRSKAAVYDRIISPPTAKLNKVDKTSNLPPAQTLTIQGLPKGLKLADLIHSVNAPGGVRFIRVVEEPRQKTNFAVVTFFSASAAEAYTRYASRHGFFTSQRVPEDTIPGPGETILGIQLAGQGHGKQSGVKRFWVLKTHIPAIQLILPSKAPSHSSDDDFVNDIDATIKAGATRSIRFKAGPKEVSRELEMFAEGAAVVVEGLSYFESQKDGQVTIVRFGGVGDAVIVRKYFGLRKGWEERVDWAKDICDKSVETLGWENLNKMDAEVSGDGRVLCDEKIEKKDLMEFSVSADSRSDLIDMSSRLDDA